MKKLAYALLALLSVFGLPANTNKNDEFIQEIALQFTSKKDRPQVEKDYVKLIQESGLKQAEQKRYIDSMPKLTNYGQLKNIWKLLSQKKTAGRVKELLDYAKQHKTAKNQYTYYTEAFKEWRDKLPAIVRGEALGVAIEEEMMKAATEGIWPQRFEKPLDAWAKMVNARILSRHLPGLPPGKEKP